MRTVVEPPTRDFAGAEFGLVIALAFGLSIMGSLSAAISYHGGPIQFGDAELIAALVLELITAPVVWLVLRSRGWKLSDFAIHASRGSTILGVIMAVAILAVWYAFEKIFGEVPTVMSASLLSAAAMSIVNPFFEELLVLAYVVQALRKRFGLTTAFNVSVTIRLLYHLYQGPLVVIPIAIFGIAVSVVYVRMGRLWPCIVAHGIVDFVALANLV